MKFAVIGHPIKHSLSPLMHQANFNRLNRSDSYIALNIPPEHFMHVRDIMETQAIDGFNVTLPHKTAIMEYLDEIDEEAKMMGAVNTVQIKDGKWIGYNTDGQGFVDSLYQNFNLHSVAGKNILIIGAGGASRALSFKLMKAGATVIVANRTLERVTDWPFQVTSVGLNEISNILQNIDICINTTPVGMEGYTIQKLHELQELNSETMVCDIIYTPKLTPLLIDARNAGCEVMNGLDMFVNQGALSFEIWTGQQADRLAMKTAVINELN